MATLTISRYKLEPLDDLIGIHQCTGINLQAKAEPPGLRCGVMWAEAFKEDEDGIVCTKT